MNLEPMNIDGNKKFTNEQVVELNQTLSPEEVKHRFRLSKKDLANYKARVIKLRKRGVPLRKWTIIAKTVNIDALTKLARSFH